MPERNCRRDEQSASRWIYPRDCRLSRPSASTPEAAVWTLQVVLSVDHRRTRCRVVLTSCCSPVTRLVRCPSAGGVAKPAAHPPSRGWLPGRAAAWDLAADQRSRCRAVWTSCCCLATRLVRCPSAHGATAPAAHPPNQGWSRGRAVGLQQERSHCRAEWTSGCRLATRLVSLSASAPVATSSV